jgi:hypothetical protein
MIRLLWATVASFGLAGCGSSYILLEVEADLTVPSEANSLHVITIDPDNLSDQLANVDFVLDDGDAFPIEVLLEPSAATPSVVRQRVTARLDGLAVARTEVEHGWEPHRTSRAKLTLQPVP